MNYKLIKYFLFAVIFGAMEAVIYDGGYSGGQYIFYKISWYHLTAIMLFVLVFSRDLKFLPLAAVIEDITFFIVSEKSLTPDSWVNHGMGGFYLCGLWIPFSYFVGIVLYIIIELFIYLYKKGGRL